MTEEEKIMFSALTNIAKEGQWYWEEYPDSHLFWAEKFECNHCEACAETPEELEVSHKPNCHIAIARAALKRLKNDASGPSVKTEKRYCPCGDDLCDGDETSYYKEEVRRVCDNETLEQLGLRDLLQEGETDNLSLPTNPGPRSGDCK